ncbi:MAG: phage holin family protein [Dysgonamonadaceae bacterium]|jgi:phage-related holin|nr:phage holin family protein [Dysgonamonadaceae bacterium]
MNVVLKYAVFLGGCIAAYFEPVRALLMLVCGLFVVDFITGVLKSHKVNRTWALKSKKLRWSFVKMFVYLAIMALTFAVCEMMALSVDTGLTVVKMEVWCIVYIEGLSIIENLLILFPGDRFLKFLHYLLSVEFLKYVPVLSNFLKEREDENRD